MKELLIIGFRTNSYVSLHNHPALAHCRLTVDTVEAIEEEGVHSYLEHHQQNTRYEGVFGVTELACSIASIIAARALLPGPDLESIRACQNKYVSRLCQQQELAAHVPQFALAKLQLKEQQLPYPLFVKPVRGSLSAYTRVVQAPDELAGYIATMQKHVQRDNMLYKQLLDAGYYTGEHSDTYDEFMCEALLEGAQICIDGFVYDGIAHLFGATRVHVLGGTNSFLRWDFPYSFGTRLDAKIRTIVLRLIKTLGLNNICFNVELKVKPSAGEIFIIEVHARPSLQFASLIERVTGYNPLRAAADIALGVRPAGVQHAFNTWPMCSSCVLRRREDALVVRVPTQKEIQEIKKQFAGVEVIVLVEEGKRLSDYRQDGETFRYGLLTIAGKNAEDIQTKWHLIEQQLGFTFDVDVR